MALAIGIGTVPAAIAGLALAGWIEANLRSPAVIVVTLSGYAIVMVLADRFGRRERSVANVSLFDAVVIGCAQALALVPGTSRSGVTISAARILGFDRRDAARFSFLLSAPVILLASVYEMGGLIVGDEAVAWLQLSIAASRLSRRRLCEHRFLHALRQSHRAASVCTVQARTGCGNSVCPGLDVCCSCSCPVTAGPLANLSSLAASRGTMPTVWPWHVFGDVAIGDETWLSGGVARSSVDLAIRDELETWYADIGR